MGRDDLVGKRKDQVVARRAVHVNRVQSRVGALHVQSSPGGDEQNVRLVSAVFLIEKAPCRRETKLFTGGYLLDVHDGVSDTALRPDDQSLQVAGLFRVRIANLRVFGDGVASEMGLWASPFSGPTDGAALGHRDDVILLSKHLGRADQDEKENRGC